MDLNGGFLALAAIALPVVGTIVGSSLTQRAASKNTEIQAQAEQNRAAEAAHQAQGGTWDQQLEMQKYIDERVNDAVAKATEDLRRQVADLNRAFRGALAELVLIKNWARDYIKQVLNTWGVEANPPRVDPHMIDIITEDDLNGTLSPEQINEIKGASREQQ